MVYTITLAPAIDYIQRVKTLKKGSLIEVILILWNLVEKE